jgi:uncharacterized protein (DUF305 family)
MRPNVLLILISIAVCNFGWQAVYGQSAGSASAPVVVQPGAPGKATKVLPSDTRAKLPPRSRKDVEFMQGMIMHHEQAVEMTALIRSRTTNAKLRLLGDRISHTQAEEIKFMQRWLLARDESTVMQMPDMETMDPKRHKQHAYLFMPGMLSPKQMTALSKARGVRFDRLFLEGMIQHHEGALVMVEELFGTPGAGQDAEIFGFASDVDSGQRAEIEIMRKMLRGKP